MIAEGLRARIGLGREEDQRHAVIDIGSNTVRLVIYDGPPRAPAVLWNEKVSARLGRDLARSGDIPAAAIDETLAALARYAIILAELGVTRVESVATAAAREASNGSELVRRAEELGLTVRVLSGEEEASASAFGAIGAFPGAEGVVADLGGGSLELVSIGGGTCREGATFPLGTLRLPALRAGGGFDNKVRKMLELAPWARASGPLYMVGGTWRALAAYAMQAVDHPLTDPHGFALAANDAAVLAQQLVRADPADLARKPEISRMRAEKLPDAAALLQVMLAELSPPALIFSSWGLREGLHFRTLSPEERSMDPLLAGVAAFAAPRCGSDVDPALIAEWTAGAARVGGENAANLRLASAHLALALHRVEPNLRAAQALEWALDKRWVGIDYGGRAMLAAALRGSLGMTAPHKRLVPLASEGELREATAWGLALRLALRFGAGARGPLSSSQLLIGAEQVELRLASHHAPLATRPVEKDLSALAGWLGAASRLAIGG